MNIETLLMDLLFYSLICVISLRFFYEGYTSLKHGKIKSMFIFRINKVILKLMVGSKEAEKRIEKLSKTARAKRWPIYYIIGGVLSSVIGILGIINAIGKIRLLSR